MTRSDDGSETDGYEEYKGRQGDDCCVRALLWSMPQVSHGQMSRLRPEREGGMVQNQELRHRQRFPHLRRLSEEC